MTKKTKKPDRELTDLQHSHDIKAENLEIVRKERDALLAAGAYITTDFTPVYPVGNVAVCVAKDAEEARAILIKLVRDGGCMCRDDMHIEKMGAGYTFILTGEY